MKVYADIGELIGSTPLIDVSTEDGRIYAKLERANPAGSIKDRAVKSMLDDARARGLLPEGTVIIEPTSGNTGIALAALAPLYGCTCIIVMPDSMSRERISLIEAYGAKVVLTDGSKGMAGAVAAAEELKKLHDGGFIPSQFDNPANPRAHYATADEIWRDTDGKVNAVIAGIGTGGTVSGIGRRLKQLGSAEIIGIEPEFSPLITRSRSGSHGIQGIGANFIPPNLDMSAVDRVITVSDEDAFEQTRFLAVNYGLLVGISSGAAYSAARDYVRANPGSICVPIFPDTGERYLSCHPFADR